MSLPLADSQSFPGARPFYSVVVFVLAGLLSITTACGSDEDADGAPHPSADGSGMDAAGDTSRPMDTQSFDAGSHDAGGDTGGGGDASGDVGVEGWRAPDVCEPLAQRVDPSEVQRTIGDGTASSCRGEVLRAAVERGGVVGFECGADATILLSKPLRVRKDLTLVGNGNVTLKGAGERRLIHLQGEGSDRQPALKLQGMRLVNGQAPGPKVDPDLEAYAGSGGAILNRGGRLTVLDSEFHDNHGAPRGRSKAGGAIYSDTSGETVIDGSYFWGNSASSGGAVAQLRTPLNIADSVIAGNQATGTGGHAKGGGNGGGVFVDGGGLSVAMCGTVLAENQATAYGGGLYRTAKEKSARTRITRSAIRGNEVFETDPSLGGGVYLAGTAVDVGQTSVTDNNAGGAGGLYVGAGSTVEIVNSTIATNVAERGLGGGLSVSPEVTGRLWHVTIARNRANHSTGFAAAIHNGAGLSLVSSIIADHQAGNSYSALSCEPGMKGGAGSIQSPRMRQNGKADPKCAPEITFADPMLGPLIEKGGVGRVLVPSEDSAAVGFAAECPDLDQLGRTRSTPCTTGALEVGRY